MGVTYIKVFTDWLDAIELLGDAERGRLFTSLLEFAKMGKPSRLSGNERFVFPMMRAQIERDIASMNEKSEQNSENGKKGAAKRWEKAKKDKNGDRYQTLASDGENSQDKEKDKEEDKDKDKDKKDNKARERADIIDYLNEKVGTNYRANAALAKKHIDARLNEGYTVEDFRTVIDKKAAEWKGTEFERFLRPETLFGTKFDSYLNAKGGDGSIPAPPVYTSDGLFDELYADEENGGDTA